MNGERVTGAEMPRVPRGRYSEPVLPLCATGGGVAIGPLRGVPFFFHSSLFT